MKLFRRDWWPGLPPTIDKRVMCSDCKFHSSAPAGWQYDRCKHPDADYGSYVRNSEPALCHDMRLSDAQCGKSAKWFVAEEPKPQTRMGETVAVGGGAGGAGRSITEDK